MFADGGDRCRRQCPAAGGLPALNTPRATTRMTLASRPGQCGPRAGSSAGAAPPETRCGLDRFDGRADRRRRHPFPEHSPAAQPSQASRGPVESPSPLAVFARPLPPDQRLPRHGIGWPDRGGGGAVLRRARLSRAGHRQQLARAIRGRSQPPSGARELEATVLCNYRHSTPTSATARRSSLFAEDGATFRS